MKNHSFFFTLCLGALIAFCFALPGRQSLPPFDRDEARYMQATSQMAETNNFIEIFFQETPRNHQPAGLYWLETLSLKAAQNLFGDKIEKNPFVYRLPALGAVFLTGAFTAFIGAVLFSPLAGILGAFLLISTLLFSVESRLATPDPCLLAVIMAMMSVLCLIVRQQEKKERTPLYQALLYWVLMGIGLLIKGPIILLTALLTPLALSATGSGREIWKRLAPFGMLLSFFIAMPWYVAIYFRTEGAFFHYALGHNFFGKITGGQETHGFPPFYYAVTFLLAFWPGAYFFVKYVPHFWKERGTWQVRFLLCWILPFWLLFEMVPTKLPHYILPIYPAIAILTAGFLLKKQLEYSKWQKICIAAYGCLWGLLSVSLPFSVMIFLKKDQIALPSFLFLFLIISLSCMAFSGWFFFKKRQISACILMLTAGLALETGIYLFALPVFPLFHVSEKTAQLFEEKRPCENSRLLSISYKEPSLVFLAGGGRTLLLGPQKAIEIMRKNSCDVLLLDKNREGSALSLAQQAGLNLKEIAKLKGQNYSNGYQMDLRFYEKEKGS